MLSSVHNSEECQKEKERLQKELALYVRICEYWKTKFIADYKKEAQDIQERLGNFARTGNL